MATSTYFCTSCGEPQPEVGQFCTNCGATIDASAIVLPAAPQPGATVRLPDNAANPAQSNGAPAPTSGLPPTTVLPPPHQPRPSRRPALPLLRLSPRMLAIGTAVIVIGLVVGGIVFARGLPFARASGVDRVITMAQSRNGDTSLVLMRSDGSNRVTLVDEPGASRRDAVAQRFSVSYISDDDFFSQIRGYGSQGAAMLVDQQRILFWYPTSDGMEVRSVDLDGGDVAKIAQASPATQLVIPDNGNKILLVETENNASRLLLGDLRGQSNVLVQNAVEVNGTLSPDGKHVAYWQRDDQGRYTLSVTDDSGANTVEIGRDLQQVWASYSADSSKLFLTHTDDKGSSFLVANADGQNQIVLSRTADGGRGDAASGRLIYEVRTSGETSLFTSDLNGEDRVEIVRGAEALSWGLTPDRKHIIFSQQRNGRFSLQISDFKHEQIQDLKRSDSQLGWYFLDNGRVLIRRSGSDGRGITLSTMKRDGTDEQVIKRDLNLFSLDFEGDDIVAGGQQDDHGILYLLGGKETVTLDDEADSYTQTRIAPDGRIIYTANFKSGPVTYIVDRTGKQRKLLVEDATILATGF